MAGGLLFLLLAHGACARPAASETPSIHVLFIGNSLTFYHDLPKMVAELAAAAGERPLRHESETPGGCTFEKHWQDGKAVAKIGSRQWDYVVLQDQSQAALVRKASMFEYGKKLAARARHQGAEPIFYMTWALENRPQDQQTITQAYTQLAYELRAKLAPVGNAWQAARRANPRLELYERDKKHPSATGTYLAACVIFATIYQHSPVGLPGAIGGLSDDAARPLQQTAWDAVQNERAVKSR